MSAKRWDIQWPLSPELVEGINGNFDFLFEKIRTLETRIAAGGGAAASSGSGVDVLGTDHQIIVTGTNPKTLGTPQNIDVDSEVQFGRLGLGAAPEAGSVLKTVGHQYTAQVDNGNSGAAFTVNWTSGNVQRLTLTAAVVMLTLSNPKAGGCYLLVLEQDGTGGRSVSWPAEVVWQGGVAPSMTASAGAIDLFAFYYDGVRYIAAGTVEGGGTVSSVGLALPAEFDVSGSPVTNSGVLAGTWAIQEAGHVLASPEGASGVPAFVSDLALAGTYKERGRSRAMGEWYTPVWNNAWLTTPSGSLSSIVCSEFKYRRSGTGIEVTWWLQATVSAGGSYYVSLAIPEGLAAVGRALNNYSVINANGTGAWGPAHCYVLDGATSITLSQYTATPVFAGACLWAGSLSFEVE